MPDSAPRSVLPLARYRFTVRCESGLELPAYAGSLLRSVLGAALRDSVCATGLSDCKACPLWRSCAYPALFETPPRPTQFNQAFTQVPNPYVIEPPPLGTTHVSAGGELVFHMVLVGAETLRQLPLIVHAWQRALRQGLGRQRVVTTLQSVDVVDASGKLTRVFDETVSRLQGHTGEWPIDGLTPVMPTAAGEVTLHFTTPLRLQHQGKPLQVHELSPRTLVSQLLRRINLMLDLHVGVRPAPFDARALVALAANLQDDRSGLQWMDWTRYSARQKQEMTLGGLLGTWTLRGEVTPLLPWLQLGQCLHLGKNATMGMGAYTLTRQTAPATASSA